MKCSHGSAHPLLQVRVPCVSNDWRYFSAMYVFKAIPNILHISYCISRYVAYIFIGLITFSSVASGLPAADLLDVSQQAFAYDPVFKAAYFNYLSIMQDLPIARADLLPALESIGTFDRVHLRNKFELPDEDPLTPAFLSGNGEFFQQFYDVTLKQPLFNYAAWKQLKSAQATVKQAQADFSAATQDLIIRVSQAYFDVLEAEDLLRFTRAEKNASYRRVEESARRYEIGLETITTVYEAQAEYDRTVANEIAGENDVINSRVALKRLTGRVYTDLARIEGEAPLIHPKPEQLASWMDTAAYQNYVILAGQYAAEAAKQNISVQRAGNFPTVDVIGNYAFNDGANIVAAGGVVIPVGSIARFRSNEASAGIFARWPLIQGGRIAASARQARYDYETRLAELEDIYQMVMVDTEQSYNDVISGISLIKADRQAIISGQNSLESVEAQFRVGTRTIVDVVVAQRNLFDVQRANATDTYEYILATLQLKFGAGTLSEIDLVQINDWLYTAPSELKKEYSIKPYDAILASMKTADYIPMRDASEIEKTLIPEQELTEANQEVRAIQAEQDKP